MDLAATCADVEVRRAMSRAQALRLTNPRRLSALLDRTNNRPGRARYARVLATAPPDTRTELEDRVFDLTSSPPASGDVERQALLEAHGHRVLRVTWPQATRGVAQVVARLSAWGAPR